MANINWRKFKEEFKFVKTHNQGIQNYHNDFLELENIAI